MALEKMKQYLDFMRYVRENGTYKQDRTGTGTYSVFGHQMRFNLQEGFPMVTTKRVSFHNIAHEVLWYLSGNTNIKYLQDNNVHIWDEWADHNGDLGPVYGAQWRRRKAWSDDYHYEFEIDQIALVIHEIKKNPNSRRLIVDSWNLGELHKMALPPCHCFFQFYVADGKLSCKLTQRSADVLLGVPYNIAGYALLTHMIAQVCDLEVGELIWSGGDCHLYSNHLEQADLQLTREPLSLSKLVLDPSIKDIDDFRFEHITLVDYQHHAAISAPVAV